MNPLIKIIKANKIPLGFISSFFISSLAFAGLEVTDPVRQWEVAMVKGDALSVVGESTADYSVMAVENGKLIPIPFQFDEKNLKGLTFVPGGVVKIDGTENVVDGHDELVFMYRDMGPKADTGVLGGAEGSVVSELEITEGGSSRYAYLVKGNSERSDKVYSYYDFDTGLITTETYSIQFDPDNITVWSDWKIKGFTGTKSAPNVLDMMKARFFVKLGFVKATLHNAIIPAKTVAVKNGPVQSILEADISIGALGIQILSGGVSTTISPQAIRYPLYASVPKAAGALSAFHIDVTVDHVDFEGTKFKTPFGPDAPLIAGQKASKDERAKYKSDFNNPWVAISSKHNWDMFFIAKFSEGFEPLVSALWYDESTGEKPNKPENFKGSSAEMGLRLDKLPVGADLMWEYSLYFGPDLWQGNDPKPTVDKIFNPPKVNVKQL